MPAGAAIDTTDFYRSQARRLRAELRDQPARLHRSLQALAQWHNLAAPKPNEPQVWKPETRQDHVQELVAATVQNMEGPILRYPARMALIRQAQRVGIANFDANLIIAATQHRLGERINRTPHRIPAWTRMLAIGLIFQAWIVAGIYWMLNHYSG